MKSIKLGIVGLGRFAKLHLQCFRQLPNVKVVAVCDLNQELAETTAHAWNAKAYRDWREMLDAEELDVVDVLTPEFAHAEPVAAALQAGCHVFVEKPLALKATVAAELIRLAELKHRVLVTGHVCRFDPRYIQVKEKIAKGAFGRLRSIYARRNNGKAFFSIYRRANPVYILGIHDLDLMHWFTGQKVVEVYTQAPPNEAGDHDLVYAMLRFEDGTIGVIENNWLLPSQAPAYMDVSMEIVGELATAHLNEPDASLVIWDDERAVAPPVISSSEIYERLTGPLFEELRHFTECVLTNEPSKIVRPEDALQAVEVAEAVVRSLELGKPVNPSQLGEL